MAAALAHLLIYAPSRIEAIPACEYTRAMVNAPTLNRLVVMMGAAGRLRNSRDRLHRPGRSEDLSWPKNDALAGE